jgi:hypothetical protein
MSVICPCGTVADDDDMDCSLCGRDLTKLRAGAASVVPTSYPTHPTDVLYRPDGSAPGPRLHDPMQHHPIEHDPIQRTHSQPTHSQHTHSEHTYSYPDSLESGDQASEPAYWWPPPQIEPAATASGSGTYRGGAVAGIVIAALVLVLAGLALGYFVIADFF